MNISYECDWIRLLMMCVYLHIWLIQCNSLVEYMNIYILCNIEIFKINFCGSHHYASTAAD